MTQVASTIRIIHGVGENISHAIPFAELLADGVTLASIDSITESISGLTVVAGAASGTDANVRISGGVAEESYSLEIECTDSDGNTIAGDVLVTVTEFIAAPLRCQQVADSLVWSVDMAPLLDSGETLSAVSSVVAAPTGPTISGATLNGTAVEFRAADLTSGEQHRFKCLVTTSGSNTRRADIIITGV